MVEKYKHNKYNILIRKFLFIFQNNIQMCILSPLHNYYLNINILSYLNVNSKQ